MSIGSILVYKEDTRIYIWGSGILNKTTIFGNANFIAVRGYHTIARLKELNYEAPSVVGDPALLLPRIFSQKATKRYKLGIIPHFIHYDNLKNLESENIKVINLCNRVEDVLRDILSCTYTVSTSLHGIIVSHAYRIPSLWIEFKGENKLAGDNVKFEDYFSSVNIKPYQGVIIDPANFNIKNTIKLFESDVQSLPSEKRVQEIQDKLIEVAPFFVKKKYRKSH